MRRLISTAAAFTLFAMGIILSAWALLNLFEPTHGFATKFLIAGGFVTAVAAYWIYEDFR